MKEKIVKKIVWDERGVSEVFGDLMILAITTTLFAVVFLMIYSLPTPDGDVIAEFECTLEPSQEGMLVEATHTGGETLTGQYTKIYLYKDDETRILDTQGSDPDNPTYGLEDDSQWDPGETWSYYYAGVEPDDSLRISVIDLKNDRLVMSSDLLGSYMNSAPIIMERWHYPRPAQNDSEVTIYVKVFEPDGYIDLDTVYFNGSSLNSSLGNVSMEDSDGDGGGFGRRRGIRGGCDNY
jgi:hypothetical protein